MENLILKIENLILTYSHGFELNIPELNFQKGKIYALVGPNGSGKTTLLNILSNLEKPDKGKIFYKQHLVNNNSMATNINKKIVLVMENPYLFKTSVFKNIAYGLKIRHKNNRKNKDIHKIVADTLDMVNLKGYEDKPAQILSCGQTQRAALARALALEPEILLLDEPFTNIDKKNTILLEEIIQKINKQLLTTIIITTHDLLQAHRLADKVISLFEGRRVNSSFENLFSADIEKSDNQKWARLDSKVKISVVTDKTGPGHIAIAPQDIILSQKKLESSARNSFKGLIKKIEIQGQKVWVSIDAGVEFTTIITKTSLDELDLAVGKEIFLTFKTTAVTVF